ncbi:MAG: methyl-accepting chemotaxis protein [Magnetococcales bacterium]|nr:methyl-accepting chemotaxis protein [Magnetococcales bacterium]
MLDHLRLWVKILLVMGIAILSVGGVLTQANLANMRDLIHQSERNALDAHLKALHNAIAAESRTAEALSALVASIPLVREKFAADDRQAMRELFVPGFSVMNKEYGVEQFQFHTPPATSWLRVHQPAKFGDDLSSFRHTVTATNKNLTPTRGMESGVAGLGARGIVPVRHNDQHIGSVEFGLTFGQLFFDTFKKRNGVDSGLHLLTREGGFKTLGSTLGTQPLLDESLLKQALTGEPLLHHAEIRGIPLAIYAAPLQDYSGKAVGVIEIAMDSSPYQASLKTARTSAISIGIGAMLFGMLLAMLLARHINRRIHTVMHGVNQVAAGDLGGTIPLTGNDEITILARATEEMRRKLHDLAAAVGDNASKLHAAAQEITSATTGEAATSSELSASVAEITSTMEELSASSTQIAEQARSVADIAKLTLDDSRKGSEAMETVLGRMRDIQADKQDSLHEILDLGAKSKQISKVMEIINAVADQTRLIAFNAALEASSAGETGRRFSVVAGEIRRLADNVTDSTNTIEARINEIQDSIHRLVLTSEKGAVGIVAGTTASANTSERLGEIVQAASQASTAAQQISLSTQQQQIASSQVVTALREIVTATSHTAHSISRISRVSQEMLSLSTRMEDLVGQFKLHAT